MGANSAIEWTDHTFNPWIGCSHVSPGCQHCYAETMMDQRWGKVEWGPGKPRIRTSAANWRKPLAWNREVLASGVRRRVFCASLADVFDPEVPEEWRRDLFDLIEQTPGLDWLLLTKRPHLVAELAAEWMRNGWPPHVWLGTSVEDQRRADERIPHLLRVPARVRFLSCEPLLGPVDLSFVLDYDKRIANEALHWHEDPIHWIICGGESGPGARPMHPQWAGSLRDQCIAAEVAYFHKQNGEYAPTDTARWPEGPPHFGALIGAGDDPNGRDVMALPDGTVTGVDWNGGPGPHLRGAVQLVRVGKHAAGRLLDGVEHNAFPE